MEWAGELDGHGIGEDAAFTILSEGPPPLTSRQQNKTSKKSQDNTWQDANRDLTLQAYPKLYTKETEASRLQRASAFDTVWSSIESRIQHCLESTDAAVYDSLLALAKLHHPKNGVPASTPAYGLHRIPTGLVLAGGVNSADHVRTFPTLANHLRSEGCYVALLRPYDFGRSVSDALNAVLRQLSGLHDTRADTFQALAAWYTDEVNASAITTRPSAGAGAIATTNPASLGIGSSRLAAIRSLDPTSNATAPNTNKERPVVIIVESTEAVLDTTLSDLVYVLSEGWPQLPVTLVLGLNIAASAVPASLTDRALDCYSYNLATAVARLDTLVEKVLLSRWPGLLLDGDVVDVLWGHFMKYYFSPGIIVKGWKLAALAHFRGQPLAALAAAAGDGDGSGASVRGEDRDGDDDSDSNEDKDELIATMKDAIDALPAAAAIEAKHLVGGGSGGGSGTSNNRGGNGVESAVTDFIWEWRRWSLAVKVMVASASSSGLTNGYTHWQLYESALDDNFSTSPTGKESLGRLERALKKIDDSKAMELLEKLVLIAKSVQNEENLDGGDGSDGGSGNNIAIKNEGIELEKELEAVQAKINKSGTDNKGEEEDGAEDQPTAEDEGEDAAATTIAAAPSGKRRDRFFSKKSRKEALLSKAQATSGKGGSNKRGTFDGTSQQSQQSPGALIAAWLYPWLNKALRNPPTQLPAAKFFTCRDASSLDCLTAAPREAIHAALTRPNLYLPALGSTPTDDNGAVSSTSTAPNNAAFATQAAALDGSLGITADVEDACLAYQLFDQDPSCANVAEWVTAFKAVHDAKDAADEVGGAKNIEKGNKKGNTATATATAGKKKKRKESEDPEKDRLLAARFSQATAELQFIGLIKPLKKRSRGDAVQRAVHMPAALMGDV